MGEVGLGAIQEGQARSAGEVGKWLIFLALGQRAALAVSLDLEGSGVRRVGGPLEQELPQDGGDSWPLTPAFSVLGKSRRLASGELTWQWGQV